MKTSEKFDMKNIVTAAMIAAIFLLGGISPAAAQASLEPFGFTTTRPIGPDATVSVVRFIYVCPKGDKITVSVSLDKRQGDFADAAEVYSAAKPLVTEDQTKAAQAACAK